MARGPKRHLKRLNAPKHWMLDKLGGIWAPRPSTGPHKLRECLPLIVLLRNRLKYALNTKEVKYILMQRLIKVDGKARTDKTYPAGFMGEPAALALTGVLCRHRKEGSVLLLQPGELSADRASLVGCCCARSCVWLRVLVCVDSLRHGLHEQAARSPARSWCSGR